MLRKFNSPFHSLGGMKSVKLATTYIKVRRRGEGLPPVTNLELDLFERPAAKTLAASFRSFICSMMVFVLEFLTCRQMK